MLIVIFFYKPLYKNYFFRLQRLLSYMRHIPQYIFFLIAALYFVLSREKIRNNRKVQKEAVVSCNDTV